MFGRAVVTSWVIVMVPFLATAGMTAANAVATAGAGAAIALGTLAFVRTQPGIRNAPQTARRWLCQAAAASFASLAGWAILAATGRARL